MPLFLFFFSSLSTSKSVGVMTVKSTHSALLRCQSIYIKSTVHEITSLRDWIVDSDALGYCLLALSKKSEGKKAV